MPSSADAGRSHSHSTRKGKSPSTRKWSKSPAERVEGRAVMSTSHSYIQGASDRGRAVTTLSPSATVIAAWGPSCPGGIDGQATPWDPSHWATYLAIASELSQASSSPRRGRQGQTERRTWAPSSNVAVKLIRLTICLLSREESASSPHHLPSIQGAWRVAHASGGLHRLSRHGERWGPEGRRPPRNLYRSARNGRQQ